MLEFVNENIEDDILPEVKKLKKKDENTKDDTPTSRNKPAHNADFKIPIIYSDEELIIIDKPFDLCLAGEFKYSVKSLMESNYRDMIEKGTGRDRKLRFCHTLDYETSGCLCIACTQKCARAISTAFSRRTAEKYYLAMVYGKMDLQDTKTKLKQESSSEAHIFSVRTYIVNEPNKSYERPLKQFAPGEHGYLQGKEAISQMQIVAYGTYQSTPVTVLIMKLLTGRTHQLRLHCKYIGFPIVGDTIYATEEQYQVNRAERMMLHSYFMKIQFQANTKAIKKNENLIVKTTDPFALLLENRQQVQSLEEVDWLHLSW